MKYLVVIFMLFTSLVYSQDESGMNLFINKNGNFVKPEFSTKNLSIIGAVEKLGYHKTDIYLYMNFKDKGGIQAIGLKLFTNEAILVIRGDKSGTLSKKEVAKYLEGFEWGKSVSGYEIERLLSDCILNKSLTIDYVANNLKIKDYTPNSRLKISSIGYYLQFKNGILTEYQSSDGLNKWAKGWKTDHKSVFQSYYAEAKKYWKQNTDAIINEINMQATAYSITPQAGKNKYVDLHITPMGNINFYNLLVAHYNYEITLEEFLTVNHGRYEIVSEYNTASGAKQTNYKVGQTIFSFSKKGKLLSSYTSK